MWISISCMSAMCPDVHCQPNKLLHNYVHLKSCREVRCRIECRISGRPSAESLQVGMDLYSLGWEPWLFNTCSQFRCVHGPAQLLDLLMAAWSLLLSHHKINARVYLCSSLCGMYHTHNKADQCIWSRVHFWSGIWATFNHMLLMSWQWECCLQMLLSVILSRKKKFLGTPVIQVTCIKVVWQCPSWAKPLLCRGKVKRIPSFGNAELQHWLCQIPEGIEKLPQCCTGRFSGMGTGNK